MGRFLCQIRQTIQTPALQCPEKKQRQKKTMVFLPLREGDSKKKKTSDP